MPHPTTLKTYGARAAAHPNPTARRLLETMERKKTNLCVSVDVTKSADVLEVVRRVAPSVCMVKVSYHFSTPPSARLGCASPR
jgi:orotidine-5'-phosphate decarboxylase